MAYLYYLVESSFVVRVTPDGVEAQRRMPDGRWVDYPDLWDVWTNGRYIDTEEEAMQTAEWLVLRDEARDRGEQAPPLPRPIARRRAPGSQQTQVLRGLFAELRRYLNRNQGRVPDALAFDQEVVFEHERFGEVTAGLVLGTDRGDEDDPHPVRLTLSLVARIGRGRSSVWISTGDPERVREDVELYCLEPDSAADELALLLRNIGELD